MEVLFRREPIEAEIQVINQGGIKKLSNLINKPIEIVDTSLPDLVDPITSKRKKKEYQEKDNSHDVKLTYSIGEQFEDLKSGESNRELGYLEQKVDIKSSYEETDNILKTSIYQLDVLTNELVGEFNKLRKTTAQITGGKYKSISEMASTISNLISTKVTATRELNNSIKNYHDLELKRSKEMKQLLDVDDDQAIMAAYNAFISTPANTSIGNDSFNNLFSFKTSDITYPTMPMQYRVDTGSNEDAIHQAYMNNMSPEQRAMLYEGNPNIQEVVVYDRNSHEKWFDVIDVSTMEVIQGVPKRSTDMFMESTTVNLASMSARNIDLDQAFRVVYSDQIRDKYNGF